MKKISRRNFIKTGAAWGAGFLGFRGEEIIMIKRAEEHGIGKLSLDDLTIKEAEL